MVPLADLAKHNTPKDCWIGIDDCVYDVTGFMDEHPGGRVALLAHAGKDATPAFYRHHSGAILQSHGPGMLVGRLDRGASIRSAHSPAEAAPPRSPFPHSSYEGTGLEAVRFQWSNLAALTSRPDDACIRSGAVFKQTNNLSPLCEDDWLHVHRAEKYVQEMQMRHRLVTRHAEEVYTAAAASQRSGEARTDRDVVDAEQEVLGMVLQWLETHAPDRFSIGVDSVRTLTPGYEHCFRFDDFADCPLRLVALLIQEDVVLMREEDVAEGGINAFDRSAVELQKEDHPTGKRHVLASGLSCFSTNVIKRHMLPMSGIHHPAVPGFQSQLQHAMNRFMTQLTPQGYFRHNYMFQDFDCVLLLDHPWAKHVCQQELLTRSHHQAADRSARFAVTADTGFFKSVRSAADVRSSMRLRCEYQTFRRLQKNSNFIVFTIKNYVDALRGLEAEPTAALALSAAIRLKPKGILFYQSMGREQAAALPAQVSRWRRQFGGFAALAGRRARALGPQRRGRWDFHFRCGGGSAEGRCGKTVEGEAYR
eukprot:CAMPEP_0117586024 /NCGR_PEP_ID=MMETSP0784-20121206/68486_1 /TAXON_ID=39447 /ORGANISM="" /LENGTH=534 /DNA_ID=CAMNT_0005387067 /DNA_START=1 /DNA_END=1601 /DNA_ORIENTATION=-